MNKPFSPLWKIKITLVTVTLMMTTLHGEEITKAETAKPDTTMSDITKPEVATSKKSALMPRQILLGPSIGIVASKLITTKDYNDLIKPTPLSREFYSAISVGASVTARWAHGISLTFAPRWETYGVETQEEIRSFPGNPFPHTLKSSTELTYALFPILLGMGWFTSQQHFQVQIGTYSSLLSSGKVEWKVDGETYPNTPFYHIRDSNWGWMLGTEYGIRIGGGEFILGLESQREFDPLMNGLRGSIKAESTRAQLSYLWSLQLR